MNPSMPVSYQECKGKINYPDPLTPEGFDALWDALTAKAFLVDVEHCLPERDYAALIWEVDGDEPRLVNDYRHADRKQALLEAAAAALGVMR